MLEPLTFSRNGDVVSWLVSETFGLAQGRGSLPAEEAIVAAQRFMARRGHENEPGLRTRDEIHARLKSSLGDGDPFWPRWLVRTGPV